MDFYILQEIDKPVIEKDMLVWSDNLRRVPESWKTVNRTRIDEHTEVVTIYTGKDHRPHEPGQPPLLWQTELHEGDKCDYMGGYATRAAAEKGHAWEVMNVRFIRGEGTVAQMARKERRNRSLFGRVRRALKGLYK